MAGGLDRLLNKFPDVPSVQRLVDIDCGSYTKAGVDEVGRWVADAFRDLGAHVELMPNEAYGDTVVGTFGDSVASGPALLMGAEGPGLSAGALAASDQRVVIPMARGVDSLNVAAAAAVACWELCRGS